MTHLSLRTIYVFSNCFLEKVCCGGLIFAARRPWNWTVGPKVILNLGKYIPIFRDGGIFGTMLCIKGGSPPPGLQPQTPFLWHSAILRRLCGGVWCGVAYLEYLLICSGVAKPPQATPTIVISEGNKSRTFKKSLKWKACKYLCPAIPYQRCRQYKRDFRTGHEKLYWSRVRHETRPFRSKYAEKRLLISHPFVLSFSNWSILRERKL